MQAIFKETYGFDMEIAQFGKPTRATYDFAEEFLKKQIEEH